jgi:thymidine kinase
MEFYTAGHLTLIIGPMYSGKSTKIINYIRKFKSIDKKMIVVKHILDNRYSDNYISSHNLDKEPCICVNDLNYVFNFNDYENSKIIIIEEGQFFDNLIIPIKKMIDVDKKIVIVSGLNGDSNRNSFGDILNLIPFADNIDFCTSLCKKCSNGTPGIFSKKIVNDDKQILVGSNESYISVCRNHYLN